MELNLLLVTFLTLSASSFVNDFEAHDSLVESPYTSIAIPYLGAYEVEQKVDHEKVRSSLDVISEQTEIDVWPWLFFNHVVGAEFHEKDSEEKRNKKKPFESLNYFAYKSDDEFYKGFKRTLQSATTYASKNNSGLVFDLEPYNNRNFYYVSEIADNLKVNEDEVKKILVDFGASFIKDVANIDTEIEIWLLYSSLNTKKYRSFYKGFEERSVEYIVKGMLSEILTNDHSIKLISGGEIGIGYCNKNLQHLKDKSNKRDRKLNEYVKLGALELGAPISPWIDKSKVTGWMKRGNCGKSTLLTLDAFEPLVDYLFNRYNYVWVYAAGHSDYKPLQKSSGAAKFNSLFDKNDFYIQSN